MYQSHTDGKSVKAISANYRMMVNNINKNASDKILQPEREGSF